MDAGLRAGVYRQGLTPHYSIYDMTQMMSIAAAGGGPEALAPKLDQWVERRWLRMRRRC